MKEKFIACYLAVFDEDGTQKAVGRRECIQLIKAAEKLCPNANPGTFGSVNPLKLNQKNLNDLYHICLENEI